MTETNLKKVQFPQFCSTEQVQRAAVYFGMQIPIFLKYFIPIFLNLNHIQSITTVNQIFQFCLHAIYILAPVFKRANLCNCQHLDLQILYKFQSNLSKKKISHATLICFHYFCILIVQCKHKNTKTTLCGMMPSSCYATLN